MKQKLVIALVCSPSTTVREVIGIDLGDRWSHYCVLSQAGTVIKEDRVRTTPEALVAKFGGLAPTRIVIEVGAHSPWASRLLQAQGHDVVVANPRKVRLIYESDRKNDRLDARMLARLGRVDVSLLAPVQHRSCAVQADLALVRSRDALVAARTQLINTALCLASIRTPTYVNAISGHQEPAQVFVATLEMPSCGALLPDSTARSAPPLNSVLPRGTLLIVRHFSEHPTRS